MTMSSSLGRLGRAGIVAWRGMNYSYGQQYTALAAGGWTSQLRLLSTETPKPVGEAAAAAAAAAAPQAQQDSAKGVRWVQGMIFGGLAVSFAYTWTIFNSGGTMPQQGSLITTKEPTKDYGAVRKAIEAVMDKDEYDDGSYGPVLVRLAWHAAGTFDKGSCTGGSNGATMRFEPECSFGANAGLKTARDLLEPIKARFPWISYADLWTLAGCVAIEYMGGPHIPWRAGREDKPDGSYCPPDGRLPDASKGAPHVRDIFNRMNFDDQEIVALVGAHSLGRCHRDRSGYDGPWTNAPTTFSNLYFVELTENKWRKKKWDGPMQYEDKSGQLMMLPADMALLWDRKFKKHVDAYAKDQDKFFVDFAKAFQKLMELGVKFPENVATY